MNAESVIPATGETVALHVYWDRMFGGYSSPYGAVFDADVKDGLASIRIDGAAASIRRNGSRKAPNSPSNTPMRTG